jgi:hypothetical protein
VRDIPVQDGELVEKLLLLQLDVGEAGLGGVQEGQGGPAVGAVALLALGGVAVLGRLGIDSAHWSKGSIFMTN